jgi:hypothetical protein
MTRVSFAKDIVPILRQFRGPMLWRFDLTRYEDVKGNAKAIYGQISTNQMPPPPFPPLTEEQVRLFKAWVAEDFPP